MLAYINNIYENKLIIAWILIGLIKPYFYICTNICNPFFIYFSICCYNLVIGKKECIPINKQNNMLIYM